MALIEIERKFLVKSNDFKKQAFKQVKIVQGFLSRDPERTVRIRRKDDKGFITIKGVGTTSGLTRFEWEKEIPVDEAAALLKLCLPGKIEKVRFEIKSGNHIFEVDEFEGENEGLVLAEIELKSEKDQFEKPHWLGVEVSGDPRYYNSYLSDHPFKSWL